MKQIVRAPDSGKTKELMEWAQRLASEYDKKIIYVCKNPIRYHLKASDYGIDSGLLFGIFFISYEEYVEKIDRIIESDNCQVVIDDVDEFLTIWSHQKVIGFTLSQEEEKR